MFKALNISIANISCNGSIFRSLLPHGDQTIAGLLEKHVLKPMLAILATYMETRLKSHQSVIVKPGLHIAVTVVSTVANMFLTLFQAVLIDVNTLITTSQA